MEIALDSADDDAAPGALRLAGRLQHRLHDRHRRLHGLGSLHQLGEEVVAVVPQLADPPDPGDEARLHRRQQIRAGGDQRLGETSRSVHVTVDDGLLHRIDVGLWHWPLPAPARAV